LRSYTIGREDNIETIPLCSKYASKCFIDQLKLSVQVYLDWRGSDALAFITSVCN